jgi:predicted HAD superfamily Cof-like phosphohydrolase
LSFTWRKKKTPTKMLLEFHRAFGAPYFRKPRLLDDDRANLRKALIQEEVHELFEALDGHSMEEIVKELCDVLYVVYGTGIEMGVDLDKAFVTVHESNMSKLGEDGKPIYREDGKVLKGPYYHHADLREFRV